MFPPISKTNRTLDRSSVTLSGGRKINSIFLNSYGVSISLYTYESEAKISCVDDNRVGRSNQRVISGVMTLANTVDSFIFCAGFHLDLYNYDSFHSYARQISRHAHPRHPWITWLFTRFLIICPMLVLMKPSINVVFGSQFLARLRTMFIVTQYDFVISDTF